jgi:ribose transport system permease protein
MMSKNTLSGPETQAPTNGASSGNREQTAKPGARPSGISRAFLGWRYRSIWIALIALFIISAIFEPKSLNATSLASVATTGAILMIVAGGQTLVMQQRGIDMSVPGTFAFCSMLPALLLKATGMPVALALILALVAAAAIGLLNGILVTRIGITPLIATLAIGSLTTGALFLSTNNVPSASALPVLTDWARANLGSVPWIFIISVVVIILAAIFMSRSTWGRRFVGVGLNPAAVRAMGYIPERYIFSAFIVSSVAAAIGGLLLIGYLGSARATSGNTYLFTSIAAPVLGGLALTGGRGSLIATGAAAFFLTQLVQVLLTAGASAAIQLFAQALAIAVAVSLRVAWPRINASMKRSRKRVQV